MIRAIVRFALLAVVGVAALGVFAPGAAHATDGPKVTLDRSEAGPGERVLVSMTGFTASKAVSIAVCGNLAQRGSADCAMASSQGKEIDPYHDVTLAELFVQPPPLPCPCLVRVTSTSGDEFAVAPLVVTGHPVGDLISTQGGPLVAVGVTAQQRSDGVLATLRTSLAGRTKYSVTVTVRNITTSPLTNVQLFGAAADRWSDELVKLPLEPPGAIDPGQTWTKKIDVELPAPHFGEIRWTVTASGAGPSVTTTNAVTAVPVLLYLFAVVFVADAVVMAIGWRRKRAARAAPMPPPDDADADLEAMWAASAASGPELTSTPR